MARINQEAAQAIQTQHYGKPLVAGLTWQPPVAKLSRAAMQRQGLQGGFGVTVRRATGTGIQVGYGPKGIGDPGAHSLAVLLAEAVRKQDWIGAFRLSDTRYALVGVRQGAIMAGRDVIGARGEVEALLRETVQLGEEAGERWEAIYAPKEFETAWPEVHLVQLLPKSALRSSAGRLESLTSELTQQQKKLLLGVGAAVLLLGIGGWAWHDLRAHHRQEELLRPPQTVEAPPPHPWKSQARPAAQLAVWKHAMAKIPLSLAGWRAEWIRFDAGSATVSYRRDGGMSVDVFQSTVATVFGDGAHLSQSGERGEVAIGVVSPAGEDEPLHSANAANVEFASHFQSLGLAPPKLAKRAVAQRLGGAADWTGYNWTLATDVPPETLFGEEFPGLRLTTMQVLFSESTPHWVLNGIFYAKN